MTMIEQSTLKAAWRKASVDDFVAALVAEGVAWLSLTPRG